MSARHQGMRWEVDMQLFLRVRIVFFFALNCLVQIVRSKLSGLNCASAQLESLYVKNNR